jgi:uncharacterized protein
MHLITEFKKYKSDEVLIGDFPNMRQDFDYDCGPTSMLMMLVYYGIEIRKDELIGKINPKDNIKKDGTPPKDIVSTFKKYNIKAEIKQNQTIDNIKSYIDKKMPVILILQAHSSKENPNYKKDKTDGHYSICIGYSDNHIIFADPSSYEKTYLTYDELEDRWHDVDKFDDKFNNTLIVVHGKKKFSKEKIKHME